MSLSRAGVCVLHAAIGTMLLSAALCQTDSGFYYPLNATPTEYAIKGLSYCAQMTRTQGQILADGSQHTTQRHFLQERDSQGRVRTDVLCAGCALTEERTQPYSAMINDPVAHRVIHLYPWRKVARIFAAPTDVSQFSGVPIDPSFELISGEARQESRETLPPQIIAGVYATGLRWKRFIPATTGGSGPNIVVVTERWYSPELKIQLLARIIDPRAGETSEVVTNLDRREPDPSEFQIPADYKIETVVTREKQAERAPQHK